MACCMTPLEVIAVACVNVAFLYGVAVTRQPGMFNCFPLCCLKFDVTEIVVIWFRTLLTCLFTGQGIVRCYRIFCACF